MYQAEPAFIEGQGIDPANVFPLTGHPVVVIPLTKDRNGLPIGVQVVGRRWNDERLLAIAEVLSEVTGGSNDHRATDEQQINYLHCRARRSACRLDCH